MGFSKVLIEIISSLPNSPGVYIFQNEVRETLYVGKAKDLKKRVSSYLDPVNKDWKIEKLWVESAFLEIKNTASELEALILEAKLIQALQPRFNLALKNSDPFLYFFFSFDKDGAFDLVRKTSSKGVYVGPFLNKSVARKIFNLLSSLLGLRKCARKIKNGCLYFHMGQCAGFCKEDFDQKDYQSRLQLAHKFLVEGPKKFMLFLKKEIERFSLELDFEKAQVYSRYLKILVESELDLKNVSSMKQILSSNFHSQHIWLINKEEQILLLLENQHGHLSKKLSLNLSALEFDSYDDILINYYRSSLVPLVIFINFDLEDEMLLLNFFQQWHSLPDKVLIQNINRHEQRMTMLDVALEMLRQEVLKIQTLAIQVQSLLMLQNPVRVIDCFDISHHQDLFIVAACVRIVNGQFDKRFYRNFKIRSTQTQNDYQSLKEVVHRRYAGELGNLPDLVLIDGGKGQLNAVKNLFPNLEFASLAKKEETLYKAYLENEKTVYFESKLDLHSPVGLLFVQLRNETHRFALKFHRSLKNRIKAENDY